MGDTEHLVDVAALERDAPDGWFSRFDIEVLYPEVAKIPDKGRYLEIGVNRGRSLWVATQAAKSSVQVWGIDELPDPGIPGTNYIQSDSHMAKWNKRVDVLFIDAGHSYDDVEWDIKKYVPFVKKGGVVLFHDYDETSPGVIRAVDEFVEKAGKHIETFGPRTSMARIQL